MAANSVGPWFRVELIEAEAKGDLAEAELARASELLGQSLISQAEYEQAVRKVESARTGAR